MHINDVIQRIPEESADEALNAIETVVIYPSSNKAQIRVYPMHEFRLWMTVERETIQIEAPAFSRQRCGLDGVVVTLKRMIYEVDEAISNGRYEPKTPPAADIVEPPAPPDDMDLPTWDAGTQCWYDAEY